MKKILIRTSLVLLLIFGLASNAAAIPISGAVSFDGTVSFDNNNLLAATAFTSFDDVFVSDTGGQGNYSPLIGGTEVTFPEFGFSFDPAATPIIPLWIVTVDGITYSLDALTLNIAFRNAGNIVIEGTGIAHITGFDDTPGTWSITANSAGGTASFSAGTVVPEPLTLLLLGSGLLGLAGLRRKLS